MRNTTKAAMIAAMVLTASVALATETPPVCGDVNNSNGVNTTDALLVLRKGVSQLVTLDCSAYDDRFSACEASVAAASVDVANCNDNLTACLSAPACGNGGVGTGEDCDVGNLNNATCETLGYAGGTLICAADCTFDTSGCFAQRFDASGPTIIDHQTGLEWEKKDAATGGVITCLGDGTIIDYCPNPHDADNYYQWSRDAGPYGAPSGSVFSDFLGKLNGANQPGCYAGHCDWRLPTLEEWDTLPTPPDAAFLPAKRSRYWTASSKGAGYAWFFNAWDGGEGFYGKTSTAVVRAVRSRS